jgi:cytochrome c551/c552
MKENGDYDNMESFMPSTSFAAPVDMEVGPDGRLYILEYGKGWFTKNADASISRIDYIAGNRPPKIKKFSVKNSSGLIPFKLEARVEAIDTDGDALSYLWDLGNGIKKTTSVPSIEHIYTKAGEHQVSVQVIDKHKASSQSNKIEIVAGNASPKLNIKLAGNRSFYFTGKPIEYQVMVSDEGAVVNKNTVYVANSYNKGSDMAGSSLGHQVYSETQAGQALMLKSDCQACHQMDRKSVGPSFKQVSAKYQKDANALSYLATKIINGGSGVWGPVAMSAHPTISEVDSKKIAQWVLSLENAAIPKASLPMLGKIIPEPAKDEDEPKNFNLFASYTDQGAFGLKPLTSTASVLLRSNKINARELVDRKNIALKDSTNSGFLVYPENNGWIKIKQIDLAGINAIELSNISSGQSGNYSIELRLDSEKGLLIGKGAFMDNGAANSQRNLLLVLKPVIDKKLHTIYVHIIADPKNAKKRPLLRSLAFIPTK